MKLLMVCTLLTVFSCGKPPALHSIYSVSEEFQLHIDTFIQNSEDSGHPLTITNLIVRFNDSLMDKNVIGLATIGGKTPIIEIDTSEWNEMSLLEKEHLMYHELGHAILGRAHRTETIYTLDDNESIPVSIMYPYFFDTHYYDINYEHYVLELFSPNNASDELYSNILDNNTETHIECKKGEF